MTHSTCFAIETATGQPELNTEPKLSSLELRMLSKGSRAPWTGILIAQDDLVRWKFKIEELKHELAQVRELHKAIRKTESELTDRKLEIEQERAKLIQELWVSQTKELGDELKKTQKHLLEAQQTKWWKHPALWLAVGVVITTSAGLLFSQVSGQ
jgi:hypothetical protein